MINEVLNNFKKVKIDTNPFSHKVINNIFPENFYTELTDNLPSIDQYTPIIKTGRVSSNYPAERFVFDLNNDTIEKLNEKQKDVFNKIIKLFTNPLFFNVIANEFKESISKRIREFSEDEKKMFGTSNFKFRIASSLVKDVTKYKLGVHTDTPSKFLTFLFYIPTDNNLKDLGTALYEPKDKEFHKNNEVKGHYPVDDFNLVKKVEFLPNTLFIFPRTNISFHGVQTINIDSAERNLLQLNYYLKSIN
ncbi:hypothetical protein IDH28_03790 [Pelagibacterales bacterium SAG-MED31]|nr:hypothetical protein [Pelagibacterales bacterium SAG-MED31]